MSLPENARDDIQTVKDKREEQYSRCEFISYAQKNKNFSAILFLLWSGFIIFWFKYCLSSKDNLMIPITILFFCLSMWFAYFSMKRIQYCIDLFHQAEERIHNTMPLPDEPRDPYYCCSKCPFKKEYELECYREECSSSSSKKCG